jgi:hypothetical protein
MCFYKLTCLFGSCAFWYKTCLPAKLTSSNVTVVHLLNKKMKTASRNSELKHTHTGGISLLKRWQISTRLHGDTTITGSTCSFHCHRRGNLKSSSNSLQCTVTTMIAELCVVLINCDTPPVFGRLT